MSRLIRLFVNPVLFRKLSDGPGPNFVPMFSTYEKQRKHTGNFPDGGELCYFIEFQPGEGEVVSDLPGRTKINGVPLWTEHKVRLWLKVIYQDMIGWIDMEHVRMIFELDLDENGDMVEKQVYPYASDD